MESRTLHGSGPMPGAISTTDIAARMLQARLVVAVAQSKAGDYDSDDACEHIAWDSFPGTCWRKDIVG